MIKSMTAFAREEQRSELGELTWEIRSVNHRYLEVFVRLPEEFRALETLVREKVGQSLSRGKVECVLRYKSTGSEATQLTVNESLVKQLISASQQVAHLLHSETRLSIHEVMRWPGVLDAEAMDLDQVQTRAIELLQTTLNSLVDSRQREGEKLGELISQRLEEMHRQVELAKKRMPEVIEALRERLQNKLADFAELEDTRVEQEMVILAQRLDIDEEMDRLDTHLEEVGRTLKQNKPIGRRLDFLMQELNREANTLGSKSADTVTTQVSVEMKVLIEQMREQIQNIE
ncbi:MAG: YicC family protein [Gammaproteobacteria bacterium]